MRTAVVLIFLSWVVFSPGVAFAADPPAEGTVLVAPPKPLADAPKLEGTDQTTATLAAGGLLSTGNSQLFAGSVNGKFEMRRGDNGFGAALLGNYGEGAVGSNALTTSTENVQGRIRYDRYLSNRVSLFLMATGRHDRFQGLNFRLNLDPGVKYLFVNGDATQFWGEAGYDFQYDARRSDALVPLNADGTPDTTAPLLAQTAMDHSARIFVGYKHAFNKEVTFNTGLEYLQSFYDSTGRANEDARINYDALFAANVAGGFALGVGFSARYDAQPLPGKESLDTVTTLSLIYSYTDLPSAPTCPCPPGPPPPAAPAPCVTPALSPPPLPPAD